MTHRLLLIPFLVIILAVVAPGRAGAAIQPDMPTSYNPLPNVCTAPAPDGVFTQKIVACVQTATQTGATQTMKLVALYMTPIMGVMFTLGLIALGLRILGGDQNMFPNIAVYLLRMGLIVMFTYNLGYYSDAIFRILTQAIALVVGPTFSPWVQIDTFLGKLMGFAPGFTLANGFMGIFSAALFSKTTGLMMGMAGIMVIFSLLMFVFQIVYVYLTAVVVLGFLIVISPIIIPLAIFNYTQHYFRTWVNMVLSTILTPVFMFAILWMFLGIFNSMIDELFTIVGGNDMHAYWQQNQPILSWLMPTDPNQVKQISDMPAQSTKDNPNVKPMSAGARLVIPPVQTFVNPYVRHSFNNSPVSVPGIDFGGNDNGVKQNLIAALISIWVFTMLMKSMLQNIPAVVGGLVSGSSLVSMRPSGLQQMAEGGANDIKNWVTSAGGGKPPAKAAARKPILK